MGIVIDLLDIVRNVSHGEFVFMEVLVLNFVAVNSDNVFLFSCFLLLL